MKNKLLLVFTFLFIVVILFYIIPSIAMSFTISELIVKSVIYVLTIAGVFTFIFINIGE